MESQSPNRPWNQEVSQGTERCSKEGGECAWTRKFTFLELLTRHLHSAVVLGSAVKEGIAMSCEQFSSIREELFN